MLLRKTILSLALALIPATSLPANESSQAWVRLAGEVVNVKEASFTLDYGRGNMMVVFEDWDWFEKQSTELRGMRVHVAGVLEGKADEPSIKLLGIYLPKFHVCHYSLDEVGIALAQSNDIRKSNELILRGQVTAQEGRRFVLDLGGRKLAVDTSKLLYNPLDDVGYQQVKIGDQVIVSTGADIDVFKSDLVEAARVISLSGGIFSP